MAFGEGKIWFDGKFVDWDDAKINIMAHVIHYGSSIFESVRVYNNKNGAAFFRLDDHVERFFDSAKIYRMELPVTKEEYKNAIIQTVKENNLTECYVRPFAFRGLGSIGVEPSKNTVHVAIAAWEWGAYLGEGVLENGVSVCVSSWNRFRPNTMPAIAKAGGNYLNSQLIKMEATREGFDEGIALDSYGFVSEGSGENVFLIRHGVVYTPPTTASILAGITRHAVFCICRDLDIRIEQHLLPRESLYIADELFFTGTAAELTPITKVDLIQIGNGKRGPITKLIQDKFFGIIKGEEEDVHGWLTYL